MIVALSFVLPIIVIFNSIMCGRILKRFQPDLNDYLSLAYGFFLFIALIQLLFIPIIAIHNATPKFFLFYLLGIQICCLIAYIINWRYSFMRIVWDFKVFAIVLVGTALVIGICFGFKEYGNFENNKYVTDILSYYKLGWKDNIFFIDKLTYIYLLEGVNRSFALLFNIHNLSYVYQYIWIISFSIIVACGIYGMYFKDSQIVFYKIFTYWIITIIVSVCSLVLVGSPSNGNAWILFSAMLIFQAHIDNVKRLKSEIGIIHVNYITLGLFCLTPSSIYIIIVSNVCLAMLSYFYKRNNATDYNILILFTTILSISIYLFLYNYIIGIIFTIISLAVYAIYLFLRKNLIVSKFFKKIDNLSTVSIKVISFIVASIILLVAIFLMTITKKFDFNPSSWEITYFLNKDLTKLGAWYWVINSLWWSLNIMIVLYALLAQFLKKKILQYIENVTLTPIILVNTMTVWNPISSNLWIKVANSNALMVTNDFIVNLVPTMINFIYYLINKNKFSRSLGVVSVLTGLVTAGLITFNVLA